jgi:hypothetical protein
MSDWRPDEYRGPRTIDELVHKSGNEADIVLLALSQPYASALSDDIAAADARAPGRVALVSVGLAAAKDVSRSSAVLPVEARLKQTVGGAMQGVNARIAEKIVREHARWYPSLNDLRALVSRWVTDTPALPSYDRASQSDDDVRAFIRTQAFAGIVTSRTGMLRTLRDSGRACEQERFRRLYDEVMQVVYAPAVSPRRESRIAGGHA